VDETIVEKLIDKNTAAIYIVHLGGVSPNMEYLRTIADKNNLLLIEDCAQSLGSTYKNKKLGTYGDFACFSFAKNIWLSGGGAIYSKNTDTILQVRMLNEKMNEAPEGLIKYRFERDLLESKRGYSEEADIEYYQNYQKTANNANIGIDINTYFLKESVYHKPSNLQATILCTQFIDIDFRNNKRNLIANTFIRNLSNCCKFQMFNHGWSIYSKLYIIPQKQILNNELIPKLVQNGVDAKHLTKSHGIHFQERFDSNPIFKKYFNESCLQNYLNIHDRILAIPISSKMQEEEINYIIQTIKLFTI
jgi:dTDP-4-amino-4,6-dideoxygalactose transaminase